MSLERNNNSYTDGHVTIKTLSALSGYNLYEKVVLTNSGYKPYYYSNSGFYFMMRCEIPENANGYLMGIKSASTASVNNTFYIQVANNTITWKIGSSTYTRAWEVGVHDIGWADGKPIYDNQLVSSGATSQSGIHSQKMAICGVNTDGTYSFIPSITLYRVDLTVYRVTSPSASSESYLERFYITGTTIYNAMKIPEASMVLYNSSGSAGTGSVSGTATYGVQLDDLRYITDSGFRDLAAIMCDDGGIASESGWEAEGTGSSNADYPSVLTKDGQSHNMCFYMAGVPANGATHTKQGSTTYDMGEIIRGRKPKWSIWNDAIKFGKYVTQPIAGERVYMWFNIFRKLGHGTNEDPVPVRLENFKDYDTSKNYPPAFNIDLDTSLAMEWHNGMAVTCTDSNSLIGIAASASNNSPDENRVFAYSRAATGGECSFCLGNLPLFNIARASQPEAMQCYGGGLAVITANTVIATMFHNESSVLGSETTNKDTLRTTTYNAQAIFNDVLNEWLRSNLEDTSTPAPNVDFVMALAHRNKEQYNTNDIIDCSSLVPKKNGTLTGNFDNRATDNQPTTTGGWCPGDQVRVGDRFVFGEQGGIAKFDNTTYYINMISGNKTDKWTPFCIPIGNGYSVDNIDKGFGITFGLMSRTSSEVSPYAKYNIFVLNGYRPNPDGVDKNYYDPLVACYFEVIEAIRATASSPVYIVGRYYGFTLPVRSFYDTTANDNLAGDYYSYPIAQSQAFWQGGKYFPSEYNVAKMDGGVAMIKWGDVGWSPSGSYKRPTHTKTISGTTYTSSMTIRMRVYHRTLSTEHAWDFLSDTLSGRGFDATSECPYIKHSTTYNIVCHTHDRIISKSTTYLDAWFSVWATLAANGQKEAMNEALYHNTVKLYKKTTTEPRDSHYTAQTSVGTVNAYIRSSGTPLSADWLSASFNGSALTPEEGEVYVVQNSGEYYLEQYIWNSATQTYMGLEHLASFYIDGINASTTDKSWTEGNYTLRIRKLANPEFAKMPDGTVGYYKQMFNFTITGPDASPATMYYIDIV